MTTILGISGFYHDSAAALLIDGRVVAAAQEERFTRKKHDESFPQNAIDFCLAKAGLSAGQLDYVGFYDKPLRKFERLLETYVAYAPSGFSSFLHAMPPWLKHKIHMARELDRGLGRQYRSRYIFSEHHESHAASAFFPSPFDEAAIMVFDGVGEWACASMGTGRDNRIELTHEQRFPHSLGLLYSAFTYYCGFKVNDGEYKLMGLAPYGTPRYTRTIMDNLIDVKDDGSLRLDMSYFNYCQGLTMTSPKFARLFGGPPRQPESQVSERDMDLAASIQKVTEEIMLKSARHVHRQTGMKNLCLAGGVALNCVSNGRILREGPFESIWVQPAAGDAGGALGVALFIWHQLLDKPRVSNAGDNQYGSLLGPAFDDCEIETLLKARGARYQKMDTDQQTCDRIAQGLDDGKVVGWFQGAMEFGPRALGSRSIIGDPRNPDMQRTMNLKVKFRESFRPFAPAVLRERAAEYFEMNDGQDSPYMLFVAPVRPAKRMEISEADSRKSGIEKLQVRRSELPAITHVDYSARIQTIDRERNGLFQQLLETFNRRTGCPVLINTSFNLGWEPIVCTPGDAYDTFLSCGIDVLCMGRYIILKDEGTGPAVLTPARAAIDREPGPDPSTRDLRLFGCLWFPALLVLIGLKLRSHYGWISPAAGIWTLAALCSLLGAVKPEAFRRFFRAWMTAVAPIEKVCSKLLLGMIFYGVITPIALVFRLVRRDGLSRRPDPSCSSYWTIRAAPANSSSYFRQS